MNIKDCIEFATEKYQGKLSMNGEPYMGHALRVSVYLKEKGYDSVYQIAGLFHDLLEVTDATEDDILKYSDKDILATIRLLTRKYTTSEDEYISQILDVPVAKAVKNACVIFDLVDLKDLDSEHISSYLKNVKQHYLGRFSPELDDIYAALEKYLIAKTTYSYIRAYDDGPLYRVNELKDSWIYNASTKQWESCDPDFLIDNEHDAYLLTEDEAIEWINDKT